MKRIYRTIYKLCALIEVEKASRKVTGYLYRHCQESYSTNGTLGIPNVNLQPSFVD
jgi:hypothetical protein